MYILKTGIRVNQVFLLYVIDEFIEFHEKKCSQNGLDPWIPSIEDRCANCYAMEPTVIAWRLSGGGGDVIVQDPHCIVPDQTVLFLLLVTLPPQETTLIASHCIVPDQTVLFLLGKRLS